jgi:hypothetical protein
LAEGVGAMSVELSDCLIVDGPNFWSLLKACGRPQTLLSEGLIDQIEERLGNLLQRQVTFGERIWVSPNLNHLRCNTDWLRRFFKTLQAHGWIIVFPKRMAIPNTVEKADDHAIRCLLLDKSEVLPSGSVLALASGDGDFVETLRSIKLQREDLFVAVITGTIPPYFYANPRLREVADFFLDILTLPCLLSKPLGTMLRK